MNKIRVMCIVLMFCHIPGIYAQENIITNPSFEENIPPVPAFDCFTPNIWTSYCAFPDDTYGIIEISEQFAVNGKKSMLISAFEPYFQGHHGDWYHSSLKQVIPVNRNIRTLKFRFNIKTIGLEGNGLVVRLIVQYDKDEFDDQAYILFEDIAYEGFSIANRFKHKIIIIDTRENEEWSQIEYSADMDPENEIEFIEVAFFLLESTTGTMIIDDVELYLE